MIGRFLSAVDAILGLIPPLLWACTLAAFGFLWWSAAHDRNAALAQRDEARAALNTLTGKVTQQKADAAARYEQLKTERDEAQARLNDAHRAQEKKDAENARVVSAQAERLRALAAAHDGRLRDPYQDPGCGRGGGGAQGAVAAGAGAGAADVPEAGGLLSAQLSGLLLRLQLEADAVNDAYASCRSDTMTVRGLPVLPVPDD